MNNIFIKKVDSKQSLLEIEKILFNLSHLGINGSHPYYKHI